MNDETASDFRNAAWRIAGRYFAPGHDREDLVQEAYVGLIQATRDYRPDSGSFPAFALLCMERRVQDAVTSARRVRHRMLTDTVRVGRDEDDAELAILDLVADPRADVPTLVEHRDTIARYTRALATLTDHERRALLGLANGLSYAEIEGKGRTYPPGEVPRWVDNAVQRARRKLREAA